MEAAARSQTRPTPAVGVSTCLPFSRLEHGSGQINVLCFPAAGVGASAFVPWLAYGSGSVKFHPCQLAGRESRMDEPPHRSVEAQAADVRRSLGDHLDSPFALFGHSFGGLVAFELARQIAATGGRPPAAVFVAASAPPAAGSRRGLRLPATIAALGQLARQQGGLRLLFTPVRRALTADIVAAAAYRPLPTPPLDSPLQVLTGRRDRAVPSSLAHGWQAWAAGPFSGAAIEGDHWFVRTSGRVVAQHVVTRLTAGPANRSSACAASGSQEASGRQGDAGYQRIGEIQGV